MEARNDVRVVVMLIPVVVLSLVREIGCVEVDMVAKAGEVEDAGNAETVTGVLLLDVSDGDDGVAFGITDVTNVGSERFEVMVGELVVEVPEFDAVASLVR